MAFKDYLPVSPSIAELFGKLHGLFNPIPTLEPAFEGVPNKPKINFAVDACSGSCSGSCSAYCAGSCNGSCKGKCSDSCKGSCRGGCVGKCSGACVGTCKSDCKDTCNGSCLGTCIGYCTNYCKTYCQTYCQYQQTWSQNDHNTSPSGAGTVFTWSVPPYEGNTIIIPADDWNDLASYIEAAGPYCGGSVSLQRAVQGNPITAIIWNNLNEGLATIRQRATDEKQKDRDLIKASEVQELQDAYNRAQFLSSLPQNNGSTPYMCCQTGMYPHDTHVVTHSVCSNGQNGNPKYGIDYGM